jgi:hypothetical protein
VHVGDSADGRDWPSLPPLIYASPERVGPRLIDSRPRDADPGLVTGRVPWAHSPENNRLRPWGSLVHDDKTVMSVGPRTVSGMNVTRSHASTLHHHHLHPLTSLVAVVPCTLNTTPKSLNILDATGCWLSRRLPRYPARHRGQTINPGRMAEDIADSRGKGLGETAIMANVPNTQVTGPQSTTLLENPTPTVAPTSGRAG